MVKFHRSIVTSAIFFVCGIAGGPAFASSAQYARPNCQPGDIPGVEPPASQSRQYSAGVWYGETLIENLLERIGEDDDAAKILTRAAKLIAERSAAMLQKEDLSLRLQCRIRGAVQGSADVIAEYLRELESSPESPSNGSSWFAAVTFCELSSQVGTGLASSCASQCDEQANCGFPSFLACATSILNRAKNYESDFSCRALVEGESRTDLLSYISRVCR